MTVVAVSDKQEMKNLMMETVKWPHPIYIRLGSGGEKIISKKERIYFWKNKNIPNQEMNIYLSPRV